ncbi:MAG: NAD-dependent epimerase/dehydratase family protein, partial [Acidobacteria bacterium]|nr:NAD-dependent epimerase/dehydratase family protein [Acidobacteriota bacterium]
MRVLVTGGTGVVGTGLIPELLTRGHAVRLLARGADDAVREWPAGVESCRADVTRPEELIGVADDCDAVVHVSGIVAEVPPDVTYERVNAGGTRNLLAEAVRAGLPKFVFISSLGADRGGSAYHVSKREAEVSVSRYAGQWVVLRSGNVYGPGDEVISKFLSMLRTLPAVPVIGNGLHEFQPIWYADLGKAIARAVESDVAPGTYELAGADTTSPNDLLSRLERLTDRHPIRIPVPEFLASLATKIANLTGLS